MTNTGATTYNLTRSDKPPLLCRLGLHGSRFIPDKTRMDFLKRFLGGGWTPEVKAAVFSHLCAPYCGRCGGHYADRTLRIHAANVAALAKLSQAEFKQAEPSIDCGRLSV